MQRTEFENKHINFTLIIIFATMNWFLLGFVGNHEWKEITVPLC